MNAADIAHPLGGRKAGGGWMARCQAHDDRTPSLSIRDAVDGTVLVRCHAGCGQERVIATLRSRGLWMENGPRRVIRPAPRAATTRRPDRDDARRSTAALAIWQSAMPTGGSLVEETALSAMQATDQTAWAALSTSGLGTSNCRQRPVVVLANGDKPGEVAALRWKGEGRRERIARPPRGFDFNDVLLSRAFNRQDAA